MPRLLLLAALSAGLTACASFPQPTATNTPVQTVVVSAGLNDLTTSTPAPSVTPASPTPTGAAFVVLAPTRTFEEGTATPIERSPLPELRPTRTIVPSTTPVPIATPFPTFVRVPIPTSTRTPAPTFGAGTTQRPTPTSAVRAPHYDLAHAQTLPLGSETAGAILAPGQSNVHRFDIHQTEGNITVTLTGPDMDLYQPMLISPDGMQFGFGMPVGAAGRQVRAQIKGQTGTWYVAVGVDPISKRTPRRAYAIRYDVKAGDPQPVG
jgi:hypothetical protein